MPWHDIEAADGSTLELFEDARGYYYPRRWRSSAASSVALPEPDVSEGLRGYRFRSPQHALHYAYRERLQRQIIERLEQQSSRRPFIDR